MVESLKELNKICQKPRYKEAGNWMVRHILRDAALPVTWLLLHTPVTANQVTLASLGVGLFGIFLIAFPGHGNFLAGALLLQFWYFLDHVDGQIARYRGTSGLTGRFFDFLTHHLIHGVIFFSLGFYSYHISGNLAFVVWGFLASVAMMTFNLVHDTKYKAFMERMKSAKTIQVLEQPASASAASQEAGFLHKGFSLLHKLAEIHVLMNLLTVAALLQYKALLDLRALLFIFYGIGVPVLALVKITFLIMRREIDHEFDRDFRI